MSCNMSQLVRAYFGQSDPGHQALGPLAIVTCGEDAASEDIRDMVVKLQNAHYHGVKLGRAFSRLPAEVQAELDCEPTPRPKEEESSAKDGPRKTGKPRKTARKPRKG